MTTPPPFPDEAPPGRAVDPGTRTGARAVNRGWYVLLLVPFAALLWLPFYARRTPELFGFPFFYWYQFAWVLLGAAVTGLVYMLTTSSEAPPPREPGGGRTAGTHRRAGRQ